MIAVWKPASIFQRSHYTRGSSSHGLGAPAPEGGYTDWSGSHNGGIEDFQESLRESRESPKEIRKT